MDTATLARQFADLCKADRHEDAGRQFWDEGIVSLEPGDGPMARCEGRPALEAKGAWWYANHTIHSVATEGPYVHGDQFILRFTMDVTPKDGERMQMDETGLYTVRAGKVVEERFFYGS